MPKIHKTQRSKRENSPVGGKTGDIYGTRHIYPHKCSFIVLCASLLNSYEDEYTHYKKGYRYTWRWESHIKPALFIKMKTKFSLMCVARLNGHRCFLSAWQKLVLLSSFNR